MPRFITKYKLSTRAGSLRLMLLTAALAGLLSGCGIKPGSLSQPSGDSAPTFPRTYPAPDAAR